MKIKKVDRREEQDILIGMIVDKNYLAKVVTIYSRDCLRNPWARTVAKWCVDYYDKYQVAPGKHIQSIYKAECKRNKVKEKEEDPIEDLLEVISDKHSNGESFNCDYILDKTESYFQRIQIENLQDELEGFLLQGKVTDATKAILGMRQVKIATTNFIDPLADVEAGEKAFEEAQKPLLPLRGAIGYMLNEQLTRASFVALQAPEKAGKTWLLNWFALEALKRKLKVALFQVGDLTQNQEVTRLKMAISKKSNKKKYCGEFKVPVKWIPDDGDSSRACPVAPKGFDVEYQMIDIKEPLTAEVAQRRCDAFYKKYALEDGEHFQMKTVGSGLINFREINQDLDVLEEETGFIPDVIIVDYLDILKKESNDYQGQDIVNETWLAGKSLCNTRNCLLIGATQADAGSYDGQLQSRENFSRDKRKYAHVNGMIGMNQTEEEKRAGIMKLNWIVAREGEYITSNACYLLQSLRRGQPVIDSMFNTDFSLQLLENREEREKERDNNKVPDAPRNKSRNRERKRRS